MFFSFWGTQHRPFRPLHIAQSGLAEDLATQVVVFCLWAQISYTIAAVVAVYFLTLSELLFEVCLFHKFTNTLKTKQN